ncbi:hypothetical protein [Brevibacillus sp. SAFN-007a]|uniref:hypothetical protein n=1 Tax=Brevibacillus sp. SAFN-007a TaxID=3436862 RepID=UPI003F8206CC
MELEAWEANRRQLELWKKTLSYEIEMMAPYSESACAGFLDRLMRFETELEQQALFPSERALVGSNARHF